MRTMTTIRTRYFTWAASGARRVGAIISTTAMATTTTVITTVVGIITTSTVTTTIITVAAVADGTMGIMTTDCSKKSNNTRTTWELGTVSGRSEVEFW